MENYKHEYSIAHTVKHLFVTQCTNQLYIKYQTLYKYAVLHK